MDQQGRTTRDQRQQPQQLQERYLESAETCLQSLYIGECTCVHSPMTVSHLLTPHPPTQAEVCLRNAHPLPLHREHMPINSDTCSHQTWAPLPPCTISTLSVTDPCIQTHIRLQYISCTPRKIHRLTLMHILYTHTPAQMAHTLTLMHSPTFTGGEMHTHLYARADIHSTHTWTGRSEPLDAKTQKPGF